VQHRRHLRDHFRPQILANHVAAERQRHAAGAFCPPLAEVDNLLQPLVLVRQLPFVDSWIRSKGITT
jgi:hypothetical protein